MQALTLDIYSTGRQSDLKGSSNQSPFTPTRSKAIELSIVTPEDRETSSIILVLAHYRS